MLLETLSLATPGIVILATFGAATRKNFVKHYIFVICYVIPKLMVEIFMSTALWIREEFFLYNPSLCICLCRYCKLSIKSRVIDKI